MQPLLDAIRNRFLPAALTSLGIVLLTAGLLSYTDPTTAGAIADASQPIVTPSPSSNGTPLPVDSGSPGPSESPGPSGSPGVRAVATRIVIPALNIDLPVVLGTDTYPLCNVAMYFSEMGQPGEGKATYIYAHARTGMFGPIYLLAHAGKQDRMLGMIVQVYTSDDKLYLYEIREIRLHQTSLADAFAATTEQLWLQTSEGPKGTPGKTQVIAYPLSVGEADPADANPTPHPVVCS